MGHRDVFARVLQSFREEDGDRGVGRVSGFNEPGFHRTLWRSPERVGVEGVVGSQADIGDRLVGHEIELRTVEMRTFRSISDNMTFGRRRCRFRWEETRLRPICCRTHIRHSLLSCAALV